MGTIRTTPGTNDPVNSGPAGTTALNPGDLVMVIQMQDAQYNNGNGVTYGDGATGRGVTAVNASGKYEFRRVVSFTAGTLVIDQGLTNSYTRAAPSAGSGASENGNRRFQVIRVPQFSTLTMPAGTTSPTAWNGETGGVWVIDVAGNLNMNGAIVDASNLGFRGAGGWPNYPLIAAATDYVNTRTFETTVNPFCSTNYDTITTTAGVYANSGAAKGEGIAGTPRLVRRQAITNSGTYETPFSYVDLGAGNVGYANGGFLSRGAPGNAGGGGTQHNAGGGGGSNVGQGGIGGNTFAFYSATNTGGCVTLAAGFFGCGGDGARTMGGLGGGTFPATIAYTMMGGGGAGDSNNACDSPLVPQAAGGNGGGIIFIRAGTITNAGTLLANGQNALPGGRDAAGGGGAGGSIVVLTSTAAPALTVSAVGGQGGNTAYSGSGGVPVAFLRAGETQGPGASGGGGAVVLSNNITGIAPTLTGGASGRVFPVQGSQATISNAYGAGAGGGLSTTVPFSPVAQAVDTNCLPQLRVNKVTTTPVLAFPDRNTAQYVITIANTGPGTAIGATPGDTLQAPFQYAPATAPNNAIGLTYVGGAQGPASTTVGTGTQTFAVGTPGSNTTTTSFFLPPNTTVTFTVTVVVNGGGITPTLSLAYQNTATVNYLDPFRAVATSQVTPGTAYAGTTTLAPGSNYAATSSTQEDVQVLGSVNLAITKTNGTTTLAAGSTTAYTVTVANFGSFPAASTTFKDPAAAGLACTTVTCTQFGTAVCPTAPNTTIALMQGTGIEPKSGSYPAPISCAGGIHGGKGRVILATT